MVLRFWPAALMDMFSVDCDGLPEAITDAGGQTTPLLVTVTPEPGENGPSGQLIEPSAWKRQVSLALPLTLPTWSVVSIVTCWPVATGVTAVILLAVVPLSPPVVIL